MAGTLQSAVLGGIENSARKMRAFLAIGDVGILRRPKQDALILRSRVLE